MSSPCPSRADCRRCRPAASSSTRCCTSCANGSAMSVRCTGSAASRRAWCCLRARRAPRRPWRWPGGLTRCRRTIGRWSTACRSGIGSRCVSRSDRCRIRGWAPSTPPAPMAARRSASSPWSSVASARRCSRSASPPGGRTRSASTAPAPAIRCRVTRSMSPAASPAPTTPGYLATAATCSMRGACAACTRAASATSTSRPRCRQVSGVPPGLTAPRPSPTRRSRSRQRSGRSARTD